MNAIQSRTKLESLFVEPYKVGVHLVKDGWRGHTVSILYTNGTLLDERDITPLARIGAIAMGILLCVPIINTLVLLILKQLESNFVSMTDDWAYRAIIFQQNPPHFTSQPEPESGIEVSGHLGDLTRTMVVNRGALNRAPDLFDIANLTPLINAAQPPVRLPELLTQFDRLFAGRDGDDILLNDQGRNITVDEARARVQTDLVNFVDEAVDSNYIRLVQGNLKAFLKMIILEFRNPEIPNNLKTEMMTRLVSAAFHCPPRRHDEALKVYRILSNQVETIEQILLQYIQMAKEDLFLAHYSLSREPVMTLNFIRREVDNLGLDRNPVNLADMYIGSNDARSPENRDHRHTTKAQFIQVFNQFYTAANVIPIIRKHLNDRIKHNNDVAANISAFINDAIQHHRTQGHITDAEINLMPKPYQNDFLDSDSCQLTEEGVKFLLCHFGFFRDTVPNGHLVRAAAVPQT